MSHPDPYPAKGSKAYSLLNALLKGEVVDTVWCMVELNLQTPNARVSELRKAGWPIRSVKKPHPKLTDEKITAYTLDNHFRRWFLHEDVVGTRHPLDYPGQDGRGKFATKTPEKPKGSSELSRALNILMKE